MKTLSHQYELLFTRQCSATIVEVWYAAENELFFKHAEIPYPKDGYMFFEYTNGIAKNYIDMPVVKGFCSTALKKILKNSKYFDNMEKLFWEHNKNIEPYF